MCQGKKRGVLLLFIISFCFCFTSYAATLVNVDVPNTDVYAPTDSVRSKLDAYSGSEYDWIPTVEELNTLVYQLENQPNKEQSFPYVTVFINGSGDNVSGNSFGASNYNLVIALSDSPFVLSAEKSGSSYYLRASSEGNVRRFYNSTSSWIYDDSSSLLLNLVIAMSSGHVYMNRDIVYANYDIPFLSMYENGVTATKGIDQNYEKYESGYHGGGGIEFGELDASIPNPVGVMATVDSSSGAVHIRWTPQVLPGYGVQILGDARMRAYKGLLTYDADSFNRFESYSFDTSYLSSYGSYDTNVSAFTFDLPHEPDYYDTKIVHWLQFRLTYYKREDGMLKLGGTTTVRINVDTGITVETEDTEGNIIVEEFDKDGNPIEDRPDNILEWLDYILRWLKRIYDSVMGLPNAFLSFFIIDMGQISHAFVGLQAALLSRFGPVMQIYELFSNMGGSMSETIPLITMETPGSLKQVLGPEIVIFDLRGYESQVGYLRLCFKCLIWLGFVWCVRSKFDTRITIS